CPPAASAAVAPGGGRRGGRAGRRTAAAPWPRRARGAAPAPPARRAGGPTRRRGEFFGASLRFLVKVRPPRRRERSGGNVGDCTGRASASPGVGPWGSRAALAGRRGS